MHDPVQRLGLVLLPGTGLLAAAGVFDALHAANAWIDGSRYEALLLSAEALSADALSLAAPSPRAPPPGALPAGAAPLDATLRGAVARGPAPADPASPRSAFPNSALAGSVLPGAVLPGAVDPGSLDTNPPLPAPPQAPRGLAEAPPLHGLFVVAARPPAPDEVLPPELAAALPRVLERGGVIGGLGAGAAWLALAGLLDGHRCTVHAPFAETLALRHPAAIVSRHLYELDRNRATCGGGTASLDMTLAWLGQRHGPHLLQRLLEHFGLERLRAGDEPQAAALPPGLRSAPKLTEAIALMEANLGEPLSTQDIAVLIGVSRRQLERLFKQHLDTLPSRWYLERRLDRARKLLQQTPQSILQIGLSCGFSSGAHFSNAYRARYGRTPRDERSARAMAWRDAADTPHRAPGPRMSP